MARQEENRENLMQDAIALERRVAFRSRSSDEAPCFTEVFAGIRQSGFLSIYFDQDPVFHFDDENRLRRAFVNNLLYRSQGTTLAQMKRVRTETETILERHYLDDRELKQFQSRAIETISQFLRLLCEDKMFLDQIIPADDDSLVPEIVARLGDVKRQKCALSPAMATKPK